MKKNQGLRKLLIAGMTREQRIVLIRRRDSAYCATDFTSWTDYSFTSLRVIWTNPSVLRILGTRPWGNVLVKPFLFLSVERMFRQYHE